MNVNTRKKGKNQVVESRLKKKQPGMELEGNQQLNKVRKLQFKKEKKKRNRQEKAKLQLAAKVDNTNTESKDAGENYDFEDFPVK